MKILLLASGGFGDAIVFTHLATLLKEKYPTYSIDFCIGDSFAFQFGNGNNKDILDILQIQNNIDKLAIMNTENGMMTYSDGTTFDSTQPSPYEKLYLQRDFFTDLGYIKSLFIDFINEEGLVPNIGETKFNVFRDKTLPEKYPLNHIAVPGVKDWENKWSNNSADVKELYQILSDRGYILHIIGPENGKSYLENLQELAKCNMYIGTFGSIGHFAAGIGVDTITLSSIYSPVWDNPEFYHSGFHKAIVCKPKFHCGTYACIQPKYYSQPKSNPKSLGPPTLEDNNPWVSTCRYTASGKSCVASVEAKDFVKALDQWEEKVDYKNRKI